MEHCREKYWYIQHAFGSRDRILMMLVGEREVGMGSGRGDIL